MKESPFFLDREVGFYYSHLSPDKNSEIVTVKIVSEKGVKIELEKIIGCNTSGFEKTGGWNMQWYKSESDKSAPDGTILSGSSQKGRIVSYAEQMLENGYDFEIPSDQIQLVRIVYILDGNHHVAYYVENGRHRIAAAKLAQLPTIKCDVTVEITINVDLEEKEELFDGKSLTEYKLKRNLGGELLDSLEVPNSQPV